MPLPIRVLFVCEGNICRSPYAAVAFEERWRSLTGERPVVASAGTRAPLGAAAHPELEPYFRDEDSIARLHAHRSRRLETRQIREHSLVITMERGQREQVLDLAPAALRRTFTLLELARLAERVLAEPAEVHDGDTLTSLTGRHRLALAAAGGEGDVADPIGGAPSDFARMAHDIDSALASTVELLRLVHR